MEITVVGIDIGGKNTSKIMMEGHVIEGNWIEPDWAASLCQNAI